MEFKVVLPDEGTEDGKIVADDWPKQSKPTMVLAFADDGTVTQVSDGSWTYHAMSQALAKLLEILIHEASHEGGGFLSE